MPRPIVAIVARADAKSPVNRIRPVLNTKVPNEIMLHKISIIKYAYIILLFPTENKVFPIENFDTFRQNSTLWISLSVNKFEKDFFTLLFCE